MRIDQAVRQQSEKPSWSIPEPVESNPTKWLRFDCPFCTGTKRFKRGNTAAINYDAGWFSCFRCDMRVSAKAQTLPADDTELAKLLTVFDVQIRRQVWTVKKKYGLWVDLNDLYLYARQLIWNYAYRPYGGPNDAGMLFEWEAMLDGDLDKLRGYVGKALYGDLMNYAQDTKKWKQARVPEVPMGDDGIFNWLARRFSTHVDSGDYWDADMADYAEDDDVSFTQWGMRGCARIRNGLTHSADCCEQAKLHLRSLSV